MIPFRDLADSPRASSRPDISQEVDTIENIVDSALQKAVRAWPGNIAAARHQFAAHIATAVAAALREAAADGRLAEVVGESMDAGGLAIIGMLLADIIDSGKPGERARIEAQCVDFVLGTAVERGKSQTAIARENSVGKASVSKRCRQLVKRLGVLPSRGMKDEEAVAAYKDRQTGKRAKPKAEPWAFAGMIAQAFRRAA